jgi:hypothetical protein
MRAHSDEDGQGKHAHKGRKTVVKGLKAFANFF